MEEAIVDMAERRSSTFCPSEVARTVGGQGWRAMMEPTRQAARRLVAQGYLEILQGGVVELVDGGGAGLLAEGRLHRQGDVADLAGRRDRVPRVADVAVDRAGQRP